MIPSLVEATNCTGGDTGPFRRVWSLPGYSWMSADIYLPSMLNNEILYGKESNDTAFVYAGGWGAQGEALDVGFQHSPTYDNWALFIRYQGAAFQTDERRFRAGQRVQLVFSVPQDEALRAVASGALTDGSIGQVQIDYNTPAPGWTAAGAGLVLKRMTSIAQDPEDFSSGSYLHNVQWSNVMIGTVQGAKVPWLSAQTGGQCMHPGPGVVTVSFLNQANEVDSIDLR